MTTADVTCVGHNVKDDAQLLRLRSQAALVRALLEEFERVVPCVGAVHTPSLGRQIADELTQLGYRILECVAAMERNPVLPEKLK
jgi:uncharacterized metal-binding protein